MQSSPLHIDFDCHPPEHWSDARKKAARIRFIARRLPTVKAELRALEEEWQELKSHRFTQNSTDA